MPKGNASSRHHSLNSVGSAFLRVSFVFNQTFLMVAKWLPVPAAPGAMCFFIHVQWKRARKSIFLNHILKVLSYSVIG